MCIQLQNYVKNYEVQDLCVVYSCEYFCKLINRFDEDMLVVWSVKKGYPFNKVSYF